MCAKENWYQFGSPVPQTQSLKGFYGSVQKTKGIQEQFNTFGVAQVSPNVSILFLVVPLLPHQWKTHLEVFNSATLIICSRIGPQSYQPGNIRRQSISSKISQTPLSFLCVFFIGCPWLLIFPMYALGDHIKKSDDSAIFIITLLLQ